MGVLLQYSQSARCGRIAEYLAEPGKSLVKKCCQTVFIPGDVALQLVVLSAQHSQAAEHFCRDLGPAENIHAVQQGKPIGVNFVRFDFADIDVFKRVALQGIDHDNLIPCIGEELKQDQMVVRSGFHDDDWLCGKLLLCTLQQTQSPVHAVLEVAVPQVGEGHVLPDLHLLVDILKVGRSKLFVPGAGRLQVPIDMVRNRIVGDSLRERESERLALLKCGEKIVDPGLADAELLRNLPNPQCLMIISL